jgi:serine/threonine protein kinase
MDKYKIQNLIGDGTYGTVWKGLNLENGDTIAIKKLKNKVKSWEECIKMKEIKALSKLKNHKNIIRLLEVIRENTGDVFMIFEYGENNLTDFIEKHRNSNRKIPEEKIKDIIYEIASGLAHTHSNGFFHRDLKPENIMFVKGYIKIADFGLATEIPNPYIIPNMTEYVCTRWYRAPECILKSTNYSWMIDVWALGCIMIEMYLLYPAFPGSTNFDQLVKIVEILGTPQFNDWPDGYRLIQIMNFKFPDIKGMTIQAYVNEASPQVVDFLKMIFNYDPLKRPNCTKIIKHEIFFNLDSNLKNENNNISYINNNNNYFGNNLKNWNRNNINNYNNNFLNGNNNNDINMNIKNPIDKNNINSLNQKIYEISNYPKFINKEDFTNYGIKYPFNGNFLNSLNDNNINNNNIYKMNMNMNINFNKNKNISTKENDNNSNFHKAIDKENFKNSFFMNTIPQQQKQNPIFNNNNNINNNDNYNSSINPITNLITFNNYGVSNQYKKIKNKNEDFNKDNFFGFGRNYNNNNINYNKNMKISNYTENDMKFQLNGIMKDINNNTNGRINSVSIFNKNNENNNLNNYMNHNTNHQMKMNFNNYYDNNNNSNMPIII